MKKYSSIPACEWFWHTDGHAQLPCIAFNKLDGSNLRFAWYHKTGWKKFGTRHRLFDESDPDFGQAIQIFLNKYADAVVKAITDDRQFRGTQEIICYCEFLGPHSFHGQHDPLHPALGMEGITSNDPKDLVLFDVNVAKKGLMPPADFVRMFGHLHIAEVIYEGMLNSKFVNDVRQGKYPIFEGVVCKGLEGKAPHGIWMRKIKTDHYKNEVKRRFNLLAWQDYLDGLTDDHPSKIAWKSREKLINLMKIEEDI